MKVEVQIVMIFMNKIKLGQSFSRETLSESYFEVECSPGSTESKKGSEIMIDIMWEQLSRIHRSQLFEASKSPEDMHDLLVNYMKD